MALKLLTEIKRNLQVLPCVEEEAMSSTRAQAEQVSPKKVSNAMVMMMNHNKMMVMMMFGKTKFLKLPFPLLCVYNKFAFFSCNFNAMKYDIILSSI